MTWSIWASVRMRLRSHRRNTDPHSTKNSSGTHGTTDGTSAIAYDDGTNYAAPLATRLNKSVQITHQQPPPSRAHLVAAVRAAMGGCHA
jgi:hypothetical protein